MSTAKVIGGIFGVTFVLIVTIVLVPMVLVAWNLYLVHNLMDIDVPDWTVYLVAMIEYILIWASSSIVVKRG